MTTLAVSAMSHQWVRRGGVALWLVLACGWGATAHALSVVPRSFDELVDLAETVVIGTVSHQESRWETPAGYRRIYTYVTLADLKMVKGTVDGNQYVLRISGGVVGDEAMSIPGMPQFQDGQRYILFVRGNQRDLFPVVGIGQGVFRVVRDERRGEEIVFTQDGRPVEAVSGGTVHASSVPQSAAQAPALSVGAFVQQIQDRLTTTGQGGE